MGNRLENLDALRGIAALTVVIYHWTHWVYYPPGGGDSAPASLLPAHDSLHLLYEHGWRAVDLFFVVSGFVFFYLYEHRIRVGEVSCGQFTLRRFSRLYPLHLATLAIVAVLQLAMVVHTGVHFVFPIGPESLLSNLALINTLDGVPSYNGPAWSVTVECFAYALFFPLARWGCLRRQLMIAGVVAVGIGGWFLNQQLGRGVAGFFAGGLAFRAFEFISRSKFRVTWRNALCAATTLAWAGCVLFAYRAPLMGRTLSSWAVNYGLFPATVLCLALTERQGDGRGRRVLSWLGSISYSSYLTHFPLQLGCALAVSYGWLSLDTMLHPTALAVFFVVLLGLSSVTYARFELPAQRWLRALARRHAAAGSVGQP